MGMLNLHQAPEIATSKEVKIAESLFKRPKTVKAAKKTSEKLY